MNQSRNQRLRSRLPSLVWAGLIVAGLSFALASGPSPVSAVPFSCRINETFAMPTMNSLVDQWGEGNIPSQYAFVAGVDSRCRSRLVKGVYVYRAKITMSTRLSAGWPDDLTDYPQGIDSSFRLFPVYTQGSGRLIDMGSPVSTWPNEYFQLQPGNLGVLQAFGTWLSELTELCVAERCTFTFEHTGTYSDPTGEGDFGIELDIENACVPITPGDPSVTVNCREADEIVPWEDPATYYHPGLSGARFTVSADLYFEPLMTWRR